jgi:hypothetical protein
MAHQATLTPVKNLGLQIEFAQHVYDNQQAIIRQLDVKAGVFVSLLVFLAIGALPIARDVSTKLHWTGRGALTSWSYAGSGLILVVGFLATAVCVQRVIRPRASEHTSLSTGLIFAPDILSHGDPEKYHDATEHATEQTLLKNLTVQIFQLSAIVQRKTDALRLARWPTMISFLAWAVNTATGAYILTW